MLKTPSKYFVLLGTFFTSLSSIFIRFSQAPSLVISAYRMLFTATMLLIPVMIKEKDEIFKINKKNFGLCIMSGFLLALHFASWIASINMTTIANSTILVTCSPLFVAFGNYIFTREKLSGNMLGGILISLLGTVIIALDSMGSGDNSMMLGNILAFMGAIFIAGHFVIGGIVRKSLSAGAYVFIVNTISTIVLFLLCFITKTPLYPYPLEEYIIFILMAFFCSILGHTMYNYLMKYVSATLISVSTLSEPIFASILALIIFKEVPSINILIGGVVILIGILYFMMIQEKAKIQTNNK